MGPATPTTSSGSTTTGPSATTPTSAGRAMFTPRRVAVALAGTVADTSTPGARLRLQGTGLSGVALSSGAGFTRIGRLRPLAGDDLVRPSPSPSTAATFHLRAPPGPQPSPQAESPRSPPPGPLTPWGPRASLCRRRAPPAGGPPPSAGRGLARGRHRAPSRFPPNTLRPPAPGSTLAPAGPTPTPPGSSSQAGRRTLARAPPPPVSLLRPQVSYATRFAPFADGSPCTSVTPSRRCWPMTAPGAAGRHVPSAHRRTPTPSAPATNGFALIEGRPSPGLGLDWPRPGAAPVGPSRALTTPPSGAFVALGLVLPLLVLARRHRRRRRPRRRRARPTGRSTPGTCRGRPMASRAPGDAAASSTWDGPPP